MSLLFVSPMAVVVRLRHSLGAAFLAFIASTLAAPAASAQPTCGASFNINNILDFSTRLTFVGDAVIAGNSITGSAITLTINNQNQSGAVWWTESMANPALGFDTTFVFQIDGSADGFAFVIQSDSPSAIGGSGSEIGYAGIPSSLAVEFDTFAFPGEIPEDHISVQTLGTAFNSADDSASLASAVIPDINDNLPHTVRILYNPPQLDIFLDDLLTPILTLTIDLQNIDKKGTSILTPDGCAWVGFTGATGGAIATQQILTWTFEDQSDQCAVPGFTSFNFSDFLSPIGLDIVGDAQSVGAAIRLTATGIEGQAGAAWFTDSRAILAPGFDTTFAFQLDGTADGFAFVIQSDSPSAIGGSGSEIGYAGIPSSLAVEFDTFAFPGEIPEDHISVQTLGAMPNSADDSASLASAPIPDINDNLPHTVRILYNPPQLDIFLDDLLTPVLTLTVDLQNLDGNGATVLSPDGCAWVGFTGATGGAAATQDILSWSFQQGAGQCIAPGITSILINAFTIPAPGELLFELVGVSGSQPLTFQWTRNGVPLTDGGNISGAATGRLVVAPTTTADSGQYEVNISNACGGVSTGISFLVQCLGDADASNATDFADITSILSNWGAVYTPPLVTGPGDANQNGAVNFEDITTVLSNWGHICQ